MKKLIVLFLAGSVVIAASSFSLLHSSGMTFCTSSPFDGSSCSGCHSGGSTTPTVTITASPAFGTGNTYTPGTAYTVSVVCTGSYPKYGFDLEILNSTSSTSALDAGTFGTVVTSNCKKVVTSGQPTNITHTSASGSSNAATFSFHWTAPSSGTAYLYCDGLGVNGTGGTGGDKVKTTSLTLTPASSTPLTVTLTNIINVKCFGGSTGAATASPVGGTTPYTYLWTNGQTTATATGFAAGTHTVTVNGTVTAVVTITQPPALAVTMNSVNASTCTSSDGSITPTASGGVSPYSYSWSNGLTTTAITGLAAGTYTLTITDANQCTKITTATVGCGTPLSVTISNTVNVKCFGGTTGSATAAAAGGTTPYTYSWSTTPVQTTQTAVGLPIGTYTVTVNGSSTATVTITQPAGALSASLNAMAASSCSATDGSITATPSGGTSPYTYSWSNGHTTAAITGLAAGSYTLTVTDANLCTKVTTATVSCPGGALSVSITNTVMVKCFGGSTGSATAAATGGTTPYTYSWNTVPVQTTQTAAGLAIGTYTVTVNGTAAATVTITQPPALAASLTAVAATSCTATDGSITAAPLGGTSPYTYSWSNGHTTAAITALAPGSYTLTVVDANLCAKVTIAAVSCPGGGADAGISSIANPIDTLCNPAFTPTVNLKCFGTSILTSCAIHYHVDSNPNQTFNWNGALSMGASVNVTLPSITVPVGTHTFTSTSSNPNGGADVNAANDQLQQTFFVTGSPAALPISEGFETSPNFPAGWALLNPDNDAAWQIVTTVAHTGTSCIGFDNCDGNGSGGNMTGTKDRFITTAYNLSSATPTASLSFDVAYALLNFKGQINSDTLVIFISTDCGSSWNQIYIKGGAALATANTTSAVCWSPSPADWRTDNIILGNLAAGQPSVMFAFENRSDWGEWIYIDNINITAITGIESFGTPSGFSIYPNPAVSSFTIEGTGSSERIHYSMYNVVGTEVKTGDITANGSVFNEKIQVGDISKGMYFIKVSDGKNTWTKKLSIR